MIGEKQLVATLTRYMGEEQRLVKQLPIEIIVGNGKRGPATCGELIGYMLTPQGDAYNPSYTPQERAWAEATKRDFGRTLTDPNYLLVVGAKSVNGEPCRLELDQPINDYITTTPTSILRAQQTEVQGKLVTYQSIDLIVNNLSNGG